jgi:hypothetical protein
MLFVHPHPPLSSAFTIQPSLYRSLLRNSLGEILKGLTALELGVLNDLCGK